MKQADVGLISAGVYTTVSLFAALAFFLVTLLTGDYSWVARMGGAAWIFLLAMIILMPTVPSLLRERTRLRGSASERLTPSTVEAGQEVSEMVKDPVCGMEIDPKTAAGSSEYKGQTYYFCNLACQRLFEEDPEKYLRS